MRLIPLLLATATLLPLACAQQQCASQCVRREFRTLDVDTRRRYFAAVAAVMSSGRYDQFTQWHLNAASTAHNTPLFLVWHRAMMREFELALQAVDPGVCLHYWAWELDSQSPEASPVFADDAYGSGPTSCLTLPWMPSDRRTCVSRDWTLSAMATPELINSLVRESDSYEAFRSPFEAGPHSTPHIQIGGNMGTMSSPRDPIFYAHHANVDRWYARWQAANPSVARTYPGGDDTQLDPFPYTVAQIYDTANLCYTYDDVTQSAAFLRRRQLAPDDDDNAVNNHNSTTTNNMPHMGVPHFNITDAAVNTTNTAAPAPANAVSHYLPTDRSNLRVIRYMTPLPDSYISMMGFNATKIREYEANWRAFTDKLNAIQGYVSPVALCRRRDLLRGLITKSNVTSFFIDTPQNSHIPIPLTAANLPSAVELVRNAAPEVIKGGESVRDQVVRIAGTWSGDKNSVANFEHAAMAGSDIPDNARASPAAASALTINGAFAGVAFAVALILVA